jgi:hypothetical protein
MGGIAFEMMRRAPDRVEHLAFLDTSALSDIPEQTERRLKLIAMAKSGEFNSVCDTLMAIIRASPRCDILRSHGKLIEPPHTSSIRLQWSLAQWTLKLTA